MKKYLFVSLAVMALPLCAAAQTNGSMSMAPNAMPGNAISAQDKIFIQTAGVAGLAEVHDGMLAESKGDSSVKMIGQRMVADHSKVNEKLTSLAKQAGDPAPMAVDAEHAAIGEKLAGLSGTAFDSEYLQTELTGHEKTIAAFKMEAADGTSPTLKSLASRTLPTLQAHLAMIKNALK